MGIPGITQKNIALSPNVATRWLRRNDMNRLLTLERYGHLSCPWAEEDFIRILKKRNVWPIVLKIENALIGYAIYELQKNSIRIIRLVIGLQHRRQGYGTYLTQRLNRHHRNLIFCDVPDRILEVQLLLKKLNFICTDHKPNYLRFVKEKP